MSILVDGVETAAKDASVSLFDTTVLRGHGCFESLRVYGELAYEVNAHMGRLRHSAQALGLPFPDENDLRLWISRMAKENGAGIVRVLLTGGGQAPFGNLPSRCLVFHAPLPVVKAQYRLLPVVAPWHPAGANWELSGVKSISYGPNMAAQQKALSAGFDDALLLGRNQEVLEAPTSAIAWVRDGCLETPALALGILASITRQKVLHAARELGLKVSEGRFVIDELLQADEVMILATSKEVRPVVQVGSHEFAVGIKSVQLLARYQEGVKAECGHLDFSAY
ncbi:MAG: hypothetical protein GY822_11150 [Deltaproteobacteria bacterium]|nr:hypothetical protein [Deltaproteobacteria bacterium]